MWNCGKRVLCTKYDQWIHERCCKLKKITPIAARFFKCKKCDKTMNGMGEEQQEIMCDEVETGEGISLSWQ